MLATGCEWAAAAVLQRDAQCLAIPMRVRPPMKTILAVSALVAASFVSGIVMADGGQPLSHDELQQLLPGAKIEITYPDGNKTMWTNVADGTLEAQSLSGDATTKHGHNGNGTGTWKISDDGMYCAHIEWRKGHTSDWCRPVVKQDDGSFTLAGSPDWKAQISK
jgi:hypothetical protein